MLVLAWFAIVGIALVAYVGAGRACGFRSLGAFAAILAGHGRGRLPDRLPRHGRRRGRRGGGAQASPQERTEALSGAAQPTPRRGARIAPWSSPEARSRAPTATPERQRDRRRPPAGERLLTFTEFDVDPGVDVDVFLSAARTESATRSRSTT